MDGSAYRDCTDLIDAELQRLVDSRRSEIAATPRGWRSLYVRRSGRIAFGIVGTMGAIATAIVTALDLGYGASFLLSSWLFAALAWVVARSIASQRLLRYLNDELRLSGDTFADTARLRERGPKEKEAELSRLRAPESIAWPLTTVALLAPLSIHLAIGLFFGARLSEFEEWMQLSGVVVGLSHLYMVRVAWRFPHHRHPWKGLLGAIAASIPGCFALSLTGGRDFFLMFLTGIPFVGLTILVTGSILIWGAYEPLGQRLDRERALQEPG